MDKKRGVVYSAFSQINATRAIALHGFAARSVAASTEGGRYFVGYKKIPLEDLI